MSCFRKSSSNARGIKPRGSEINAIVAAVPELRAFGDRYAALFGRTAPSHDTIMTAFERAAAWLGMRVELAKWDLFARAMEEISWRVARKEMELLKPAYLLASKLDPSVQHQLANTHTLLTAMSRIAKKAASSRKANREAEAEGRTPLRGKLAKRAQRAATKAALASLQAAGEAEGTAGGKLKKKGTPAR